MWNFFGTWARKGERRPDASMTRSASYFFPFDVFAPTTWFFLTSSSLTLTPHFTSAPASRASLMRCFESPLRDTAISSIGGSGGTMRLLWLSGDQKIHLLFWV